MLSGPSFRSTFVLRFHYQLVNLVCLSVDFFSSAFPGLYTLVCASPKISRNFLFVIILIFSTHFTINLFYLHNWKT